MNAISRRYVVSAFIGCLGTVTAGAQQQMPPEPKATISRPPLDAARAERKLVPASAFRTDVFKDSLLSEDQKRTILGNLAIVGLSLQTAPTTMQQFFAPVPPSQATGMACFANFAGTPAEMLALKKTVAGLVEKNKVADLPKFIQGIPKECPYKELYYYLDVLTQLTKE